MCPGSLLCVTAQAGLCWACCLRQEDAQQMRFSEVGALGGLDLKRNASVSGSLARGGAEEMASQAPWAVGAVFEKEENGGLEEQV